ncbi:MAG: hypothetical protein H0W61_03340 [Bacteroidetes bacterium]|nr:hypothetical protein [Bacteroidota bacterium]
MEDRMLLQSNNYSAATNYSKMILNTATGDFFLSFDAATLKSDDAKFDSTLASYGEQIIVYKGNISESLFRFNQQIDDEKEYNMNGVLVTNGTEVACIAQFDPVSLADKTDVRNYRMDFKLIVDAGKMRIKGLEGKLMKDVIFQVKGGRLNVQP